MGDPLFSQPQILFTDRTISPNATVQILLPRPSVGGWEPNPVIARTAQRVETGLTVTSGFHTFDELTYQSEFVTDEIMALIMRLWQSTPQRQAFYFQRHKAFGTPYPSSVQAAHANLWETVRWKVGYDRLQRKPNAARGLWTVTLEMESEAVEV
jgi:hypothetical protein